MIAWRLRWHETITFRYHHLSGEKFAQLYIPIDVLHKNGSQEKSRKSLIQRWATQLEVLHTDSYSILRAVLTRSALIVDEERRGASHAVYY